tara:strand:- start:37 stop:564 length:528 start_codon:yes stop_codon:yes gene_type:complete
MIQNTNFVYHPESLLETQVISLILVFFYTNGMIAHYDKSIDNRKNIESDLKNQATSNFILMTLLIEHIISWFIFKFRHYDIEKNGRMDINGVKRAPVELKLSSLQFFVSCIILGFTLKHMLQQEEFYKKEQLKTLWIIIDCLLMFLTQTYISYSLFMKVKGEIVKNIYTLYFLQV